MSDIEWTDVTWNPVTGCTKVSPGCAHCYAETFSKRNMAGWKGRDFSDVQFHPERLKQPSKWRKPRRIFVNSMSDLFHEKVKYHQATLIFHEMVSENRHIYQVLTKRPERMQVFVALYIDQHYNGDRARFENENRHIWLGVSVEDQKRANERVPLLLDIPAGLRFLSCEPLLGPLDLRLHWLLGSSVSRKAIEWVIVGGESGVKARPMESDWVHWLKEQCEDAGVPFFFKQWGGRNKKASGRELAGVEYMEFPL